MASLPIFLRPSVKMKEIDLTQRATLTDATIGAVVGEFMRGPLDPTYISGTVESFTSKYGLLANPALSFAHDTVTTFMTQSNNCLVKRTTNVAKHAGVSTVLDRDRKRLVNFPFVVGSDDGYSEGPSRIVLLSFKTNPFVALNSFKMDITDGATVTSTTPVTYNTNHNTTLQNVAASIVTTMNTFATGGSATVYQETSSSGANNWLIAIRPPKTADLSFLNASVTLGTTQPVVTIYEDDLLFDVFAENPGTWANDIGVKYTSFDLGTRERWKLTLSGAFVTANSLSVTVNDTVVTVPFATDSDTTLAALATALTALPSIYSATPESIDGMTDNDRTILIIAQKPGKDALTFTNAVITGGTSQAVVSIDRYLTGAAPDNTFLIEVYDRSDVSDYIDRFEVSLQNQTSKMGSQQNIEYVVNTASTRSINIRVKQNPSTVLSTFSLYDTTTGDLPSAESNIRWLNGGDDGVACTTADINAAWNALDDRVNWPFNIMLNAGYSAKTVQHTMASLAEKRSDSIAILDAPSDKQDANTLRLYRLNELDLDTSFAAMYTPDVQIEDINTGERRFIPPSGPVGATYAYSDRLTSQLGAPAGLNRGKMTIVTDLRIRYKNAEQELLHPIGINLIMDKKLTGPTVWDEETLQVKSSVLSSVHARRILNMIKTSLADGLEWSLFEPHTEATRYMAKQIGTSVLAPIKKGGGLYDYRIICDDTNNTPDVIDADVLAYDVYLKIVHVIKGIYVRAILTRTGVAFDEIISMSDSL